MCRVTIPRACHQGTWQPGMATIRSWISCCWLGLGWTCRGGSLPCMALWAALHYTLLPSMDTSRSVHTLLGTFNEVQDHICMAVWTALLCSLLRRMGANFHFRQDLVVFWQFAWYAYVIVLLYLSSLYPTAHCSSARILADTCQWLRKEKKRKKRKRKDYAFRRQFNEKPSIILGCPGPMAYSTSCAVCALVLWERLHSISSPAG
jgi:hypothetical protein